MHKISLTKCHYITQSFVVYIIQFDCLLFHAFNSKNSDENAFKLTKSSKCEICLNHRYYQSSVHRKIKKSKVCFLYFALLKIKLEIPVSASF